MSLGERIRRLRTARGWSSGQLSKESDVSRAYLWQLETGGKENPSLDVLQRLANALGVSVSEFSEASEDFSTESRLPPGLEEFVCLKKKALGVTKTDIEVMRNIHFRGRQPEDPEDWELLYLFLRKWAQ
jgi:transcriptional regulator with XRE-family HTH domain